MVNLTRLQLQCLDDLANEAQMFRIILALERPMSSDNQRHYCGELLRLISQRSPTQIARMEIALSRAVSS